MPNVHYIAHDGNETVLEVEPGNNLMMAAVFEGIREIEGICGGCLSCATCHVYVDAAWADRLPPPSADELRMLDEVAAERATLVDITKAEGKPEKDLEWKEQPLRLRVFNDPGEVRAAARSQCHRSPASWSRAASPCVGRSASTTQASQDLTLGRWSGSTHIQFIECACRGLCCPRRGAI